MRNVVDVKGKRIIFWHNLWCGDSALKCAFPSLFRMARDQAVAVGDSFSCSNNIIHWNVHFVRNVHDWEVDLISNFYGRLYNAKAVQGCG